ncbi:MAG TPA: GNAT family N-acetyltransferase [Aggregatilineaceae bacterium]|nr:GNAT family N-acetyltransferase [Aggregatilineaceae bacterium]
MDIVENPRSEADVALLLHEVSASPFIGQMTLQEVEHWLTAKTIRFFYQDVAMVGFGAWDNIDSDWCEIGPFYSLETFRGQGLGTQIVETLVTLNANSNLYAVTKNPIARKLFARLGFREVSVLALPWPVVRHLLSRVSFGRLVNLTRKLSLDPITHHIKGRQGLG